LAVSRRAGQRLVLVQEDRDVRRIARDDRQLLPTQPQQPVGGGLVGRDDLLREFEDVAHDALVDE
jgi:hypothetical protein